MPSRPAIQPTAVEPTAGGGERGEHGAAEADEEHGVLGLAQERVLLLVVQLPHGAQAVPHRAHPADAGEQQQRRPRSGRWCRRCRPGSDVELVGDAGHLFGDLVLKVGLLLLAERAAPIAAPTVSSGNSATKLVKVIAAASRVQFTRSRRSNDRQACVSIRRATSGPMTGSFFSQSMIRPAPGTEDQCVGSPNAHDRRRDMGRHPVNHQFRGDGSCSCQSAAQWQIATNWRYGGDTVASMSADTVPTVTGPGPDLSRRLALQLDT